ncbi:HEAT repeat domain-containing protein, partial [Planctomycetota bacterium]
GSNPESLAILLKQARDISGPYRKDALQGLGKLKTIQGLIALREIVSNPDDPCQEFTIRILADCGDKDSLPILEKLYRNPQVSESIRRAALKAFEKLTK